MGNILNWEDLQMGNIHEWRGLEDSQMEKISL